VSAFAPYLSFATSFFSIPRQGELQGSLMGIPLPHFQSDLRRWTTFLFSRSQYVGQRGWCFLFFGVLSCFLFWCGFFWVFFVCFSFFFFFCVRFFFLWRLGCAEASKALSPSLRFKFRGSPGVGHLLLLKEVFFPAPLPRKSPCPSVWSFFFLFS